MMADESLHIGRDGVEIRGRDVIYIGILLVFSAGLTWSFMQHLQNDEARHKDIERYNKDLIERMGMMQQEHVALTKVIERNTITMESLTERINEQSWLMLASPEDEKRAKRRLDTPPRFR